MVIIAHNATFLPCHPFQGKETMTQQYTIVLYGNPAFLAEAQCALCDTRSCNLVCIDSSRLDAARRLHELEPDVMIAELSASHSNHATAFLHHHPTLPLIGIDTMNNRVIVLSSQPTLSSLVNQLAGLLMGRPFSRERSVGDKHAREE